MNLKQEDYSLKTRKRAFELIEKLFINSMDSSFFEWIAKGGPFKSEKGNVTIEELRELIDIFANRNPYQYQNVANVKFEDSLPVAGTTGEADGQYDYSNNTISILNRYIENIQKNPIRFTELIELIGHEQRHHYQFDHREDVLSGEYINDIYKEMSEGNLDDNDIEEINNFLIENNLSKEKMTQKEISQYQFGGYLSNACEIDARRHGYEFTMKMFESMIDDELCPKKLKEKLNKSLIKFEKREQKKIEAEKLKMDKFKCFRKKIKKAFQKILKEDSSKLSSIKHIQLLNKCMGHISKEMSTEEKIEFMNWAIENNYVSILQNISFDDKSSEKEAILKYIESIVENKKINIVNVETIFYLVAFQHKDDEKKSVDSYKLMMSKMIETNQFEAFSAVAFIVRKGLGFEPIIKQIKEQTKSYLENKNKEFSVIYHGLYRSLNNLLLSDIEEKDKIQLGALLNDLIKNRENIFDLAQSEINNEIF